jgi:CHC2 zinc finger
MTYYLSSCDKFLTDFGLLNWDDMAWFDKEERAWKDSLPSFSFNEIREWFPESKKIHKAVLEAELLILKNNLLKADNIERVTDDLIFRKSPKEDEWFWKALVYEMYIKELREGTEQKIKRIVHQLYSLKNGGKEKIGSGVTEAMKERARAYPIDELVEFKRGVACCLWHSEKTGSMHYYKKDNRVKCFGCGMYGDSIAVYMKIYNVGFIEAVKKLS